MGLPGNRVITLLFFSLNCIACGMVVSRVFKISGSVNCLKIPTSYTGLHYHSPLIKVSSVSTSIHSTQLCSWRDISFRSFHILKTRVWLPWFRPWGYFRRAPSSTKGELDTSIVSNSKYDYILRFDGGSRGNPGISGSGTVLYMKTSINIFNEIWHNSNNLGNSYTNNQAEYDGLIKGLEYCACNKLSSILIQGDSKLVVNQIKGDFKVSHPNMKLLHKEAIQLLANIQDWSIEHIPREENKRADHFSNVAMDSILIQSKNLITTK